jgi:P pilus assembly chaperone PapD
MFPRVRRTIIALLLLAFAPPALADMVLDKVILDFAPDAPARDDIEVWNNGGERIYVTVEPREIVAPGRADEHGATDPDPAKLGLLVTPQRLILEPGERRLVRIAAIVPRGPQDRIYRVTIKPVVGDVSAAQTAIKVMVGYDALVIYRPAAPLGTVTATRTGKAIIFANDGNSNVEMYQGRQCDAAGKDCRDLPARRLYAGARWEQPLERDTPVEYRITTGRTSVVKRF